MAIDGLCFLFWLFIRAVGVQCQHVMSFVSSSVSVAFLAAITELPSPVIITIEICGLFLANSLLCWMSSHMSFWGRSSFYLAILINILVGLNFPFINASRGLKIVASSLCREHQYCYFAYILHTDAIDNFIL